MQRESCYCKELSFPQENRVDVEKVNRRGQKYSPSTLKQQGWFDRKHILRMEHVLHETGMEHASHLYVR